MTFDGWLEEIEVYSTRFERLAGDLGHLTTPEFITLIKWLKEAYSVGYEEGCLHGYDVEEERP